MYKDRKPYVRHHKISIGNQFLLKQRKTKSRPPYDPEPYTVTEVKGHQVKAEREGQTQNV